MSNYIFKLSEKVSREHVRYRNRYGITIASDLYTVRNYVSIENDVYLFIGGNGQIVDKFYGKADYHNAKNLIVKVKWLE